MWFEFSVHKDFAGYLELMWEIDRILQLQRVNKIGLWAELNHIKFSTVRKEHTEDDFDAHLANLAEQ